ncbi:sulfite exporter TauE/SafE family protein [Nitriliruptoraceae bacterium ZYF776]|nr:sulfite exporter TauE/SafE family protein [Profundirhabdus halotolerans]
MTASDAPTSPWRRRGAALAVGLLAGALSGLFGIGGGTVIVPALTAIAGVGQRLAHGTSLAAVLPIALAGGAGYALGGAVDLLAVVPLAAGSIVGALLGARLLERLPERGLRIAFAVFLLVVAVQLVVQPTATAEVVPAARDAWTIVALVALGLATGVAAGLLGIGGGTVVVPGLILLLGVSDVVAKGTSLALILPTSVAGTIGNVRRGNVDLELAAFVGLGGVVTSFASANLALVLDPRVSVPLFAAFLVVIAARLAWRSRRA